VLMALERVIKAAVTRGATCSICGQAPSVYPEITEKLVEWGITSVSVNRDVIDETREIIAAAEQRSSTAAS
jgi:pyruvate,water dikinase